MDLPQELLDYIVDLGSDYLDLSDCALVCRRLRSRAQWHLYQTVELMTSLCIDQLLNLLRVNPQLATYISEITTTSQQFVPLHGLDLRVALLLFRIKQIAPNSSIYLDIRPHDTRLVQYDTTSTRFVAPPAQIACLSLVTSLALLFVAEFPSILLFYLTNLENFTMETMDFHPALDTFGSPHLVQLATSLCRSITTLSIKNSDENDNHKFPGILIASCHSLESLVLDSVTFTDVMVVSASLRPKITLLEIAHFGYNMVKTLVDFLVDLSELVELVDFTEPRDHEEFSSEEYKDIVESLRYLLHASKGSLVDLRLLHCGTSYIRFIYVSKLTYRIPRSCEHLA